MGMIWEAYGKGVPLVRVLEKIPNGLKTPCISYCKNGGIFQPSDLLVYQRVRGFFCPGFFVVAIAETNTAKASATGWLEDDMASFWGAGLGTILHEAHSKFAPLKLPNCLPKRNFRIQTTIKHHGKWLVFCCLQLLTEMGSVKSSDHWATS